MTHRVQIAQLRQIGGTIASAHNTYKSKQLLYKSDLISKETQYEVHVFVPTPDKQPTLGSQAFFTDLIEAVTFYNNVEGV